MIRILASLVFLILVAAYATPCLIAIWRAHRRWPAVVAINIALGWTIVGWFVTLAMALGLRMPKFRKRPKRRVKRAPRPAPPVTSSTPVAATVREHFDPPEVDDEAYARWLGGGAAMNA